MAIEISERLERMDEQANEVIRNWTFGALVANLLPPPFDAMAVAVVFARMGRRLAELYDVPIGWSELKGLGKGIGKGIGAVAFASTVGSGFYAATSALKWIPGANLWIALLVQPPIVAAIAHSAGQAFKEYFRFRINENRQLTPAELQELAAAALRGKLS